MFISEQYGWVSELSGEFFEATIVLGYSHYCLLAYSTDSVRDVDLMLMGL